MELTYHQALKIKYDYSGLVNRQFGNLVTDIIIVPSEVKFFEEYMDCYYSTRNDLQCIKRFDAHRFSIFIIFGELIAKSPAPYQDFEDFTRKHAVEFDMQVYSLS